MKAASKAPRISLADVLPAQHLVFEYPVRLDNDCRDPLWEQIRKARALYNQIVAIMRDVVAEARAKTLAEAGPEAHRLSVEIEACTQRFEAAKAANDEPGMKAAAQQRRDLRREFFPILSTTRKAIRDQLKPIYAKVGKSSATLTYQARCAAVADGLGWATANAMLDNAMKAWQKTIAAGGAPSFSIGSEKPQDTLSLQFTTAGGIPAEKLLTGAHTELGIKPPSGNSSYGEIRFRLGAAAAGTDATGTWDYYRPIPDGAMVSMARLVVRRKGVGQDVALQLLVRMPDPIQMPVPEHRKPLACVHFGWALDVDGRRVAAISHDPDPGFARLVKLDPSIEADLQRSAEIRSKRDTRKIELVAAVKAFNPDDAPEAQAEELRALRRVRPEHINAQRLYRLSYQLSDAGIEIPGLTAWRKLDRKEWQAEYGIARRARNRRAEAYRAIARDLTRGYQSVCIEPLDLATAAEKIDTATGERSEFTAKARRGRVVAALFELRSAIAWECKKTRTPLIEFSGPTVTVCAHCGAHSGAEEGPKPHGDSVRELHCASCGAVTDRKLHGAARAYQLVYPEVERLLKQFQEESQTLSEAAASEAVERKARMAAGRQTARAARAAQ